MAASVENEPFSCAGAGVAAARSRACDPHVLGSSSRI